MTERSDRRRGARPGSGRRSTPFDELPPLDKLRVVRDQIGSRSQTSPSDEITQRRVAAVVSALELRPAERAIAEINIFRTVPTAVRGDDIDALVNPSTRPEFPLTEIFVTFPNERSGDTDIISVRRDRVLRYTEDAPRERTRIDQLITRVAEGRNETQADRLSRLVFEIKFMDTLISGQKQYAEEHTSSRMQQPGTARVTSNMERYNMQKSALILEYLKTARKWKGDRLYTSGKGSDDRHLTLAMHYLTETGKLPHLFQNDASRLTTQRGKTIVTTEINIAELKRARNASPHASPHARVADRICKTLQIA